MSIVDGVGDAQKYYEYNEYGKAEELGNADFINENTFTGAVSEGGDIYYMNARFYDANTGRFLSQDTYKGNAWEPWSQNLYSYVGNNPTNYIDPTGHIPLPIQKIDGGKKYRRPETITKVVDVKVYFDGNDATDQYKQFALDGMNTWNQSDVYDPENRCYYNHTVNVTEVTDKSKADLVLYIHVEGNIPHWLGSLEKAGGIETSMRPDGTFVKTPITDEIHMYTWWDDWTRREDEFINIIAHEFGHYLSLNDAYTVRTENGDTKYYGDKKAPSGSIMLGVKGDFIITYYDLGILFGNNTNYDEYTVLLE